MGYLKIRDKFLNDKLKENGDLVCHYCGKKHLEIGFLDMQFIDFNNKNSNLATIDHKIPVSKGCRKKDITNWLVSCKVCNTLKGKMDYEEFINSEELKNIKNDRR